MLLYLTSNAYQTLDKLIAYIPHYRAGLKVAFIPTAGSLYTSKPWQNADREKLVALGFIVKDVTLEDKKKEQIQKELRDVDVIFVAGGNTFYLLEHAQKSGFMEIAKSLIAQGVIYIGSSAGSLLVGPNIQPADRFDDPNVSHLQSFDAMHIVDFIILPHYGRKEELALYKEVQESYQRYSFIPLRNNEAVLVTDTGYTIIS